MYTKKTKIVCTLGPATDKPEMIEKLVLNGMNVARLNMSHNTYDYHEKVIRAIRAVERKLKTPIAILMDLQGPRFRVGKLSEGIPVKMGDTVILFPEKAKMRKVLPGTYVPVQYKNLFRDVKPGHVILIEDGTIHLRVRKIHGNLTLCDVEAPGIVLSHKGMNFPDSHINYPTVTKKDLRDLEFGIKNQVEYVALSFVREPADITNTHKRIAVLQKKYHQKVRIPGTSKAEQPVVRTRIIAKIECREAVENFAEILEVTDGIMVARGDLGLQTPIERIPTLQKRMIRECVNRGRPIIVATQMLDSMIRNPIPTRAEVSDVANAILDGTDAIMLSGESAAGKYPIKAVQVMTKAAHELEISHLEEYADPMVSRSISVTEAVGQGVQQIAQEISAKLIVCATSSGYTARNIAKHKPNIPIIAITPFEKTKRQLILTWGVQPYLAPYVSSLTQLISSISKIVKNNKLAKKGDKIVICAGHPFGYMGETNLIRVYTVE